MSQIHLKLDDADLAAFELLLDRLAQGLRHMKWAVAEYRKDAAERPTDGKAVPLHMEDVSLTGKE